MTTSHSIQSLLGNDLTALAVCVALLGCYQIYLIIRVRRDPYYSVQSINMIARSEWVRQIIAKREVITAVQTLRNSTMAATFLASTAILLIVGVLTLSEQGEKLGAVWHSLNFVGAVNTQIWTIKVLAILIDLFVAFFSFAMSIRTYNHVGFMLYVPAHMEHPILTADYVAHHLNRAGSLYSIGMRAYYTLVPLVFWLFGPLFMIVATIGLLFTLNTFDRATR
jgi:uncharacterized membrane protein